MKLDDKEILIKTAKLLNKQELAMYIQNGWQNDFVETEETLAAEYENLLFCLFEVYNEIASDYLPLYCTEIIEVKNNNFDLTTLQKKFREVKKLTNQNGKQEVFEIEYNNLSAKNGIYTLKYRYLPDMEEITNSEMQNFNGKISESVMAYGICSYYCLRNSFNDLYTIWETKFKQALLLAQQKTSHLYIKPRRFL